MAKTAAQIEAIIAQYELARDHILAGGQSYEITTSAGGGTKRVYTGADLGLIEKMISKYESDLATINSSRAVRIGIGW